LGLVQKILFLMVGLGVISALFFAIIIAFVYDEKGEYRKHEEATKFIKIGFATSLIGWIIASLYLGRVIY
jgi:hypothetical protein